MMTRRRQYPASLLTVRSAGFEQLDTLPGRVSLVLLVLGRLQSFLLPANRLLKVAALRIRGGERGKEVGRFPGGQLASLGGVLDRSLAVVKRFFRTSGQ